MRGGADERLLGAGGAETSYGYPTGSCQGRRGSQSAATHRDVVTGHWIGTEAEQNPTLPYPEGISGQHWVQFSRLYSSTIPGRKNSYGGMLWKTAWFQHAHDAK